MKGIILAGGTGSRLHPLTKVLNKHLLPIFDKPMIYYPLATLLSAGIREILIICTEKDLNLFKDLLGSGTDLGIDLQFAVQSEPKGIADAFLVGKRFIGEANCALILGDNIFHGSGLGRQLMNYRAEIGARMFAYQVSNPTQYGVVEFNSSGKVLSIEEKPEFPKSNYAVPGLYFFDSDVVSVASTVQPSKRGEKEITDILKNYLNRDLLNVEILPRGTAWLDTGSFSTLNDASNFVRILEERQGQKIACLEEISWRQGWIDTIELLNLAVNMNNEYKAYVNKLIESEEMRDW